MRDEKFCEVENVRKSANPTINVIKLFFLCHSQLAEISYSFCPSRVKPSKCIIFIGFSLTHKYGTKLESLFRDKHSSLFDRCITNEELRFITLTSNVKTTFFSSLMAGQISKSVCTGQPVQAESNKCE